MKKNKSVFRCLIVLLLLVMNEALMAQESAIYAGGPVYYHRDYAIDELRNSGFTTVIVWTIHIQANGDLTFNGEFPLVENGVYVGDQLYPNFPDDIAMLKTAPTSVTRVEFGLSAAGSGTFAAVQDFYNSEGFGPGTTLYDNFSALKNAIPGIDAFNNDDESTYHVASAVAFTKMLAELGFKNAIVPYTNSGFWSALVSQVNAEYPGNIDRNYLQCYAGGSGNNPCSPSWDFGIPVYPGMWGGPGHSSTASVENQMNSWQNNCGITGGFMWIYDDFDNSPNVAAYAAAINNALAPAGAPGNASAPNPLNGTTDVNTGTTLTWTAGSGATSHDVYFGTSANPSFVNNQAGISYSTGVLTPNTTYYWRIDEVNTHGTTTGAVWSFTTGNGSECTDCIDFNAVTIASYSNQDANGTYYIEDGGATAHLVNNTWKRTTQTYTITANTVVEFEFRSTAQGEIHGIGFDENNSLSSNRIFKVHGTQNWGIGTYDNYSTIGNYTTYTIPVGSFYTGNAMYLILVNDNDSGSGNNSHFRNIRIYENTGAKMVAANAVQTILDEPDDEPMEVSGTPLSVYPNPFTDHIALRLPVDHEFTRIRMFDSSGRLILDRHIRPGTKVLNSDKLQNAEKGIYLLRLENEQHTLTYKLLKK